MESTGTQYINTGFYYPNHIIEIDFETLRTSIGATGMIFFGYNSNSLELLFYFRGHQTHYLGGEEYHTEFLSLNTRCVLTISTFSGNLWVKLNNNTLIKSNSKSVKNAPIYLFGYDNDGTGNFLLPNSFAFQRIYSFKLYDIENKLEMNLVPRIFQKNAGFYDTVSGKFFVSETDKLIGG